MALNEKIMGFFYFINFFMVKLRLYGYNKSYYQKMDFSCSIKILAHFQNLATMVKFSHFFRNIFLYIKIDIHINLHVKISKIVFYRLKALLSMILSSCIFNDLNFNNDHKRINISNIMFSKMY